MLSKSTAKLMIKQNSLEAIERRRVKKPIKRRKRTSIACIYCWKSKTGCSVSRPCARCKRLGYEDCVDRPMETRKRQNVIKKQKKIKSRCCNKTTTKKKRRHRKNLKKNITKQHEKKNSNLEPPEKKRRLINNDNICSMPPSSAHSIMNVAASPVSPMSMSPDIFPSRINLKFSTHNTHSNYNSAPNVDNNYNNRSSEWYQNGNDVFNNTAFNYKPPNINSIRMNSYKWCIDLNYDTEDDEQFQLNQLITSSHQIDGNTKIEPSIY